MANLRKRDQSTKQRTNKMDTNHDNVLGMISEREGNLTNKFIIDSKTKKLRPKPKKKSKK